jgi:hypothetical protein
MGVQGGSWFHREGNDPGTCMVSIKVVPYSEISNVRKYLDQKILMTADFFGGASGRVNALKGLSHQKN